MGRQSYWIFLQWINEQSITKDGPAVLGHFGLLLGSVDQQKHACEMFSKGKKLPAAGQAAHTERDGTYESTWFSKDRMRGYGEVLKALSAIASITSCSPGKNKKSFVDKNLCTFPKIAEGLLNQDIKSFQFGISSNHNTTFEDLITFFFCPKDCI